MVQGEFIVGFFEKIYDRLPLFFQNVMVSVKGYLNNRERYGRTYDEYRAFLRDYDTWTLEKKLEHQREQLVSFVRFTYENSAFYREFYKDVDIDSIRTVEDLKKLPILEKETLRKQIADIVIDTGEPCLKCTTGGTTGKSLQIAMTHTDMMRRMAMLDHFKAKVGFEHRKMRRATFNGKHIVPPRQIKKVFWRYNAACKQKIYSSFHITEENLKYYVEDLNRFKPQALDGFFTSMCDIAGYIERHNIPLTFKPVAIFPTSETLSNEGRALLERVFGCKVYNQYASSEGAPFVNECPNQQLHVVLASGVFEPYGDHDEVLVTSFTTRATPLIRYRIGDCMIFDRQAVCSCGDTSLLVKAIEGRKLDFLYTAEGAKINAGNISNLLKYLPNVVIHSQFVQTVKHEVTLLIEVEKRCSNRNTRT
jgi:phenylacetate-CoA ligase